MSAESVNGFTCQLCAIFEGDAQRVESGANRIAGVVIWPRLDLGQVDKALYGVVGDKIVPVPQRTLPAMSPAATPNCALNLASDAQVRSVKAHYRGMLFAL